MKGRCEDVFMDAWAGRYCVKCGKVRTKNPSKKCFRCLAKSCCRTCRGMGEVRSYEGRTLVTSGCNACGGTGTVSRAKNPMPPPAAPEVSTRVYPAVMGYRAELRYDGKTIPIGGFSSEARAIGAAERWRRTALNLEAGEGPERRFTSRS